MSKRLLARLLTLFITIHYSFASYGQADTTVVFTDNHPLVYEDVWDLWPYSFLNDNGEPSGFNIDLIKMMMAELKIPYVIKLKAEKEVFNDLKANKADLTLGLSAGYHDAYGKYSENSITLFTQSVAVPKSKTINVKRFRDLAKYKVIVKDSSLIHHMMIDYGWGENALPSSDMRQSILSVSAKEEGEIVWNTLSLKWLMRRYHIENLELDPVNMPHGEYRFMSNNQKLLDLLDETYTKLYTAEEIMPLQVKWFYPESQDEGMTRVEWWLIILLGVVLIGTLFYILSYSIQSRKLGMLNAQRNQRLTLIMQTSHVRIRTYNTKTKQFAFHNENGQVAYTFSRKEYGQRYAPESHEKIKEVISQLTLSKKASPEAPEVPDVEIEVRAYTEDSENSTKKVVHDYKAIFGVLDRDKDGNALTIICTEKDISDEKEQKQLEEERVLHYKAIFNTDDLGIMFFDKNGLLADANQKACSLYEAEGKQIEVKKTRLNELFDLGTDDLRTLDGYQGEQQLGFQLMTVDDEGGHLMGLFAFCWKPENHEEARRALQEAKELLADENKQLQTYTDTIDNLLLDSDVRIATYSPSNHILTILRSTKETQHALTQTRCMTLVARYSNKVAMRMLNDMDDRVDKPLRTDISTTLRIKNRRKLVVRFSMMPVKDKEGAIHCYMGLLQDVSELRHVERQMDEQSAKVQEVENAKNSFLNNMLSEIRKPMDSVVEEVEHIGIEAPAANEEQYCQSIQKNAEKLLHLINNTLELSRLEAGMVEFSHHPHDIAEIFESQCKTGWSPYQNAQTTYQVINSYDQLVVDIDAENLGKTIIQVVANAAQHTKSGIVKARCEYMGRRLIITIDDSGEGIPPEIVEQLNNPDPNGTETAKGLGLAIAKEIVRQMGGTVEINSELGSGTTVYITIPCHASVIKRKKLV